ncbi:MAG TPA: site-2 protease family protein [Ruminococcaceae bacterium]|nr:site-2 protease family protein [Oscillospiraceae bacterium]
MFSPFSSFAAQGIFSFLEKMIYTLPVLLIAFPVHECAHALMASALGDKTAKYQGRLTLNPLRHLDVMGTICLLLFRIGWAKPVPIDPRNFKRPRLGMAITALAGPVSNLLMSVLSVFLLWLVEITAVFPFSVTQTVVTFLLVSAQINVGLFIFNLIPIPPFDGSRVLALFLSRDTEASFYHYQGAAQLVLMALLYLGFLSRPLIYVEQTVLQGILSIFALA